jgi:hypothetical protein
MSKGRHRRPGKPAMVITRTAAGAGAGGLVITTLLAPTAASAAPLHFRPVTETTGKVLLPEVAAPRVVTVGKGQYLSGIAQKDCGTPQDWTGIYDKNVKIIGKNPDLITPGEKLTLSCKTGWAPKPPVVVETVAAVTPQYHKSYSSPVVDVSNVSTTGDGSFQSCVISRESGGDPQVMNSSMHYGLYQFDYGTWVSGGGDPADFGHASVAEQNRVFASVYAARGTQPWAPSDGC